MKEIKVSLSIENVVNGISQKDNFSRDFTIFGSNEEEVLKNLILGTVGTYFRTYPITSEEWVKKVDKIKEFLYN